MSTQGAVLICVANPASCRPIVETGLQLAKEQKLAVKVVSVLTPCPLNAEDSQTMQQLYTITRRCGAELTVFFNDSPALVTAVYARQCGATHLVTGIPGGEHIPQQNPFVKTLRSILPTVPFTLVAPDGRNVVCPAYEPVSVT